MGFFKDIRCVIVESPYMGDIDRNEDYARRCIADCLSRGEAPFASHLLYAQEGVLRDALPEERAWGIDAGLAIGERMDATVVYTDLGVSPGMVQGVDRAIAADRPIEYRAFGDVQPCPSTCALEELNLWMAEWNIPEEQREWLLRWANRRARNVFDFLSEPMQDIARMGTPAQGDYRSQFQSAQFVARCALRTCALDGGENADRGNSIDPTSAHVGRSDRGDTMGNRQSADKQGGDVR